MIDAVTTIARKSLPELYALWRTLGTIGCDWNFRTDEPFLHFPSRTPRDEIWNWFEDQHPDFIVGEVQAGIRHA